MSILHLKETDGTIPAPSDNSSTCQMRKTPRCLWPGDMEPGSSNVLYWWDIAPDTRAVPIPPPSPGPDLLEQVMASCPSSLGQGTPPDPSPVALRDAWLPVHLTGKGGLAPTPSQPAPPSLSAWKLPEDFSQLQASSTLNFSSVGLVASCAQQVPRKQASRGLLQVVARHLKPVVGYIPTLRLGQC